MTTHQHSKSNQMWSPPSEGNIIDLTVNSNGSIYQYRSQSQIDFSMFAKSAMHELKLIILLWIKVTGCNLLEMLPLFTGKILVGHISNTESALLLSAVGLAQIYTNVTAISIGWGFTTGLFTLIPQCIGANGTDLIPLHTQTAFYMTLIVLIISTILQFFSGDILCFILSFKNDSAICGYITTYCLSLIPFIFCTIWFTILQRVLQNVQLNSQLLLIVFICNIATPILNYFLILKSKLGYLGAAITMDFVIVFMLILSCFLLCYKGYSNIFKPISIGQVLNKYNVFTYLKLSLPGVITTCFSWWIGELITILSGVIYDPYVAIASTVICYSLFEILLEFSVGLGNAINIRIGKYIGAGSIAFAKRAGKVGIYLACLWAFIVVFILLILRKYIPLIYTNDENIISITSELIYFLAMICVCYIFFQVLTSIYRALGKPEIVAWITFISQIIGFLITFLPLYGLNARQYTDLGLYSVWSCATFGYLLAIFAIGTMFVKRYKTIWKQAVKESNQRVTKTTNNYGSTTTNTPM